jgi:tetratricopeptide (TPR) repeat protein
MRNADYQSEETIWRDVVKKRPGNLRARNDLAVALSESGKIEEALKEYDKVFTSIPKEILKKLKEGNIIVVDTFITNSFEYQYFRANVNKAVLMLNQGKWDDALGLYIEALKIAPFNINIIERLKSILRQKNIPESHLDYEILCLLENAKNRIKTDLK